MEVRHHLVIVVTGILIAPVGACILPLLVVVIIIDRLTRPSVPCHLHRLAVIVGVVPQWHWPLMSPPPPHPCCCHHHPLPLLSSLSCRHAHCHHRHGTVILAIAIVVIAVMPHHHHTVVALATLVALAVDSQLMRGHDQRWW